VAVGDVNGDGKPDLAVANAFSDSVSVLLNTTAEGAATASFAAVSFFNAGDFPRSVAVGDVNGDGKPDLAVANGASDSVSVLLNTTVAGAATASFAAKSDFTTGSGPYGVAVGDVNGDGKPDIAVANGSSDSVSVLLNNASFVANSNNTAVTLFGNVLTITDSGGGLSVDLTGLQDGNTNNTEASLVGTTLHITDTNGEVTADLSGLNKPSNVVWVAKSGGDFTTISAALTAITDASASNSYLIHVAPGTYTETVTMKDFVDIEGSGEGNTKITGTGTALGGTTCSPSSDATATVIGANAELRFLTIDNTNTGTAIGVYSGDNTATGLIHVTIKVADSSAASASLCFTATGLAGSPAPYIRNATLNLGVATDNSFIKREGAGSAKATIISSQVTGSAETNAAFCIGTWSDDGGYSSVTCP
jgi:hypothetical protein